MNGGRIGAGSKMDSSSTWVSEYKSAPSVATCVDVYDSITEGGGGTKSIGDGVRSGVF